VSNVLGERVNFSLITAPNFVSSVRHSWEARIARMTQYLFG
jgi:hypothetical protein